MFQRLNSFVTSLAIPSLLIVSTASVVAAQSDASRSTLRSEIRAFLLENPEILMEMVALLEAREQALKTSADRELVALNADALFADGFSFVAGNPNGSLTLVEFVDYQCGFCRRAHPDVRALVESDGDIRLIIKELPILGPGSELGARAAISALILSGGDAYLRANDELMGLNVPITDETLDRTLIEADLDPAEIRAGMYDPEVTRRLRETQALAQLLEITGTPTFVVESSVVRGYLPLADMRNLVAELRRNPSSP
jgi:protein-disulfide isomerase